MTPRQRYKECILFGNPDRIPLCPGWPRESTLAVWHSQGLPQGVDFFDTALDILGISREARLNKPYIGSNFRMLPEFEPKVLEHRDGHLIIRDWMGAVTEISDTYDETYLRTAKDFVTRRWHRFPVENREDWAEMKKRYNPDSPGRFGKNFVKDCLKLESQSNVVTMGFNGIFWQLREWCGLENLCILMLDDPELVHEMAEFWTGFVSAMLDRIQPEIPIDSMMISEDMAYKAHCMISPEMTREFILPAYKKWVPKIYEAGCSVIELDSDGCVDELIPIWIEAGINCCSPAEVAAGCNILNYRKKYGRHMAYMQGIDKRVIAVGGKALEEHVMSIVPELFREGGYIPGCDHGVPPDISWQNYVEFTGLLAKLSGWL